MSASREVATEAGGVTLARDEDAAFDALPDEPGSAGDALRRLATALCRGRLSHALLFSGPKGSGKRHAALRLTQLLACEERRDGAELLRPCRACGSCMRVERGLDSEVVVLQPPWDERKKDFKAEIPVAQVRALQQRLSLRSDAGRRVAIIDPADRLSDVAQEALLKTLEEPPRGVVLCLLTSRPSRLKPTVRSRCQAVRLAAPTAGAIARVLQEVRGLDAESGRLAASLSGGDLPRALALDPGEAADAWIELARALYEVLGRGGTARARDLAVDVASGGAGQGGRGGATREELADWLQLLERIVRDVMVAGERLAADPDVAVVSDISHPGGEKAVTALAGRLAPVAAARALAEVEKARDDLALHLGAKLVLSDLLLQVHSLRTPRHRR